MAIYKKLVERMKEEEKFQLTAKLCHDILDPLLDLYHNNQQSQVYQQLSTLICDPYVYQVLADTLDILASKVYNT